MQIHLFWPKLIYLLALIPILLVAYVWRLRRRRRYAVRYASLALVRPARPAFRGWRRHLPFGLFLLALACLVIACGRPYSIRTVPSDQTVIVLAMDVSRSMCSADITPTRLQAAEQAALDFIHHQKSTTRIGLVAFSGFAELVQPPTADPAQLQAAVHSLLLGTTTAIGSGILKSLDTIALADPNVSPSQPILPSGDAGQPVYPPPGQAPPAAGAPAEPPPAVSRPPDIIILLTDGVNNTGPAPLAAARQAAERGVRVYTIGYGTADGSLLPDCPSSSVGNEPAGGKLLPVQVDGDQPHGVGSQFRDQEFGYLPYVAGSGASTGSTGYPRGIDEKTLKQVSALTGGKYYPADSASELHQVFQNLATLRITQHTAREVSVVFAGLGALLAVLAVGLSLLWRPV